MPAEESKIAQSQLARDREPPLRPEPMDGGIPAGERGEIENNTNPDDAEGEDPGLTTEALAGSNTDTIGNAVSDLDGDRDDQPDSDNPNDYGQE